MAIRNYQDGGGRHLEFIRIENSAVRLLFIRIYLFIYYLFIYLLFIRIENSLDPPSPKTPPYNQT